MAITQSLHRALQQYPERVAIQGRGLQRSFRELVDRVARLANGLRSIGLKTSDRVAILSLNSDRYIESVLATLWSGGAVNPCNIRWSAKEIAYSLQDSESTILIVDGTFAPMAEAIRADCDIVKSVIDTDDGGERAGMLSYEALIERSAPAPDEYRTGTDLAGIFYTGGTTGFPKGVALSHDNLLTAATSILAEGVATRGGTYLHAAPMFHLADLGMLVVHLLMGNTHAVIPGFSADAVLRSLRDDDVTDVLLVPAMIQMLLDHPSALEGLAQCRLRRIVYGASPIAESLLDRAMEAFPGAEFIQAYGMTELAPLATLNPHANHIGEARRLGRHRAAGRASFCTEVKVVDPQGDECPRGTVGEVIVRGGNMMLGYWKRPEETRSAVRDGWMHTGDAAWMDDTGLIYIVDRLKDMIVSGGENVYSAEVENAVASHPSVASCAVIGIPSREWGESVHAVIVLKPGHQTTADAIVTHCRSLIAGYKCPRSTEFRDSLPLSGAGKTLKTELRRPHWTDAEHRFA